MSNFAEVILTKFVPLNDDPNIGSMKQVKVTRRIMTLIDQKNNVVETFFAPVIMKRRTKITFGGNIYLAISPDDVTFRHCGAAK